MAGPLEGITVVSLEQAVAAPFATRQLADLGARVIKVERPEGDFARGYDKKVRGMASYFVWLNRSKESVVLDLKTEHGMGILRRIVARADVFVQNLGPGVVERLGMGSEDALAITPTLIYASVSGYGRGGPYEQKKAYDLLVQCEAGLLSVTGTPESTAKAGISVADIAAGMYVYSGVLASLIQRGRTGRGQVIEVSMLDALGEWMQQPYLYAEYGGMQQPRTGARHATIAPYGPFPTADGTVFLGVQNEREWEAFCTTVLCDAALLGDGRFSGNAARVENRTELESVVAARLSGLTVMEALSRLDAAGIANASLRDMADFSRHPQFEQRDRWVVFPSPVGPLRGLRPPVTTMGFDYRYDAVPTLGEHTDAVVREFGG